MRKTLLNISPARLVLWTLPVLVATSVALVLSGCSSDWLVSDSGVSSEDTVSFFEQPYYSDALSKRTDIVTAQTRYCEAFLPISSGGVIALEDNPDIEAFVVTPYSYPADTTFTVEVTKLVTNTGETPVIYNFGPDGLQFSRPAVLRINAFALFGENCGSVDFFWLNEETGEWEIQSSQEPGDDGTVWFSVEHFTAYGTASGGTDTAK